MFWPQNIWRVISALSFSSGIFFQHKMSMVNLTPYGLVAIAHGSTHELFWHVQQSKMELNLHIYFNMAKKPSLYSKSFQALRPAFGQASPRPKMPPEPIA
jgi:hypothetical protein